MKRFLLMIVILLIPAIAFSETVNTFDANKLRSTLAPLTDGSKGEGVTALQKRLAGFGCDAGTADGKYGPKTHKAVALFQEKTGLPVTGIADVETLIMLMTPPAGTTGIIDNSGLVYHLPGCALAGAVDGKQIEYYSGTTDALENTGYSPCAECVPAEMPEPGSAETAYADSAVIECVVNVHSKKFHRPGCDSARDIIFSNRYDYSGPLQFLLDLGYVPCRKCKPDR